MNFEIIWRGPGWYGPLSESDGAFGPEIIRFYRVNTDAGKDDPFTASADAYGQVGTPDWYGSREEFIRANFGMGGDAP